MPVAARLCQVQPSSLVGDGSSETSPKHCREGWPEREELKRLRESCGRFRKHGHLKHAWSALPFASRGACDGESCSRQCIWPTDGALRRLALMESVTPILIENSVATMRIFEAGDAPADGWAMTSRHPPNPTTDSVLREARIRRHVDLLVRNFQQMLAILLPIRPSVRFQ